MMNHVCQNCQQARATVHITDTMPKKSERHLCERCAEKEGIIVKQHATTHAILQEFLKAKTVLGGGESISCDRCGMSFREFQSTGQLGCPHDYEVFRPLLATLIERAHNGATQHIGKMPARVGEALRQKTGLARLRKDLRLAVEAEDYERAARLRDEIRILEAGGDAGAA
ncbi:MAG: UvrB/UvrC motif-containing protein [Phycisphaerae bacterium]